MEKFEYKPEVNYDLVNEAKSSSAVEHLQPFKEGFLKPLGQHLSSADELRSYLNSAAVTEEIRQQFTFQQKDIESILMNILRAYSDLEEKLEFKNIDSLSRRDYFNYFQDNEVDEAKVSFIIFLKTYEYIKVFNIRVREYWQQLQGIFEKIKPTSVNQFFLEQVLQYKIYPRLELCDLTDLLLRRMAMILQIKSEKDLHDKIQAKGEYTSVVNYNIATLYDENLENILTEMPSHKTEEQKITKQPVSGGLGSWKEIKDSAIKDPYFLDSRGKELFNQSYLYILEINSEKFKVEEQKIRRSVYIETHLGAEDNVLRQDLIRKFISQAKKKDRIKEYSSFLDEYFFFGRDTLLLHFAGLSDKDKNIFLYHFGPVYFLKVILHFMREGRTGFIHRRLKKEQMVRELPFEYLKFVLKDWWDKQVYQKLDKTSRNSREAYTRIMQTVRDLWRDEQPDVLLKIKENGAMHRAFKRHDVNTLGKFIEGEISYLYYVIFMRFLGPDFVYLPVHKHRISGY